MNIHPCTECVKNEPLPCLNMQNNLKPHAIKCCICLEARDKYLTYQSRCNFCFPCFIKMFYDLKSITTDATEKKKYEIYVKFGKRMTGYLYMINEEYIDKDYRAYIYPDLIITCQDKK